MAARARPLPAAVEALDFPAGRVHAFVHGEASTVRAIRRHLLVDRGLPREALSISGYWKRDRTEEGWREDKAEWNRLVELDAAYRHRRAVPDSRSSLRSHWRRPWLMALGLPLRCPLPARALVLPDGLLALRGSRGVARVAVIRSSYRQDERVKLDGQMPFPPCFTRVQRWGGHRTVPTEESPMILRIDRLATEMPPPSDPDPAGAAVVQELLGGKFGEMSTFMNYTFQSFNFRARQGARPFYDLVANIAAEEFGHIELVCDGDQHDAHRRRREGRRCPSRPTCSTRSTSSPAARARSSRTRTASPGTATTSPRPATSSRT